MNVLCAADKPHARHTETTRVERFLGSSNQRRMIGEAEIIVRAHVEYTFPASDRDVSILKSIFLVPIKGHTALSVAWTLVYELVFYAIFISWFFSGRLFVVFCVTWLFAITYVGAVTHLTQSTFIDFLTSPYNIEFLAGVCAGWLFKNRVTNGRILWTLLIVSALALITTGQYVLAQRMALGVGFASILLLSIGTRLDRIAPANFFMIVGNASYSIYLIHNPIISLALRLLKKIQIISVLPAFVITLVLCIVLGIIYSKFFEEIILKQLKTWLLPKLSLSPSKNAVNL